jgi:hypothetical protein
MSGFDVCRTLNSQVAENFVHYLTTSLVNLMSGENAGQNASTVMTMVGILVSINP